MWLKLYFLELLKAVLIFSWTARIACVNGQTDVYRLSNNTKPESYKIVINVDTDCAKTKFDGVVTIKLIALEETDKITLHSKNLNIGYIEFITPHKPIEVTHQILAPVADILTLELSDTLAIDQVYDLKITYDGELSNDRLGFYQSSYNSNDGKRICLASTQFAPTQARRSFPCYDEPRFKADFDITLKHPFGTTALSNEQNISVEETNDGKIVTTFRRVEKLPPYLVGFVISDFGYKFDNAEGINHRVYSRKNELLHVDFPLKFATNVYQHFAKYFAVSLPLNQMKHIAIPDFYFSAMENWGMITYKESRFLFDPALHTVNLMNSITNVIAHEVAHHWFGNLVTMKWWTHVWLKEGFATLYSYYGQDAIHPEYNAIELLIVEKLQNVFTIDSNPTIKPMSKYIEKQDEIMANYDKIAYDKACCVLRMIEHAFTRDAFKKGIIKYLENNKHSNTEEDDLFNSLQEALPEIHRYLDVKKIMTSWTQQRGYPVVTVTRKYIDSSIHLKQERYLNTGQSDNVSLWWIPVNFVIGPEDKFTGYEFWLNESEASLSCSDYMKLCSNNWVILNNEQTGYYRVNYDEENWNLIADALKTNHRQFHVHNRAQLIDDAFNLALVGRMRYTTVFNLISYISKDIDYAPWAAVKRGLNTLRQYLAAEPDMGKFQKYVQELVEKPYQDIGIQNGADEKFLRKFTRQVVVSLACEYGLPDCINEQRDYSYPNLREIYYCNKLRVSSNYMFRKLRNILKTTTDPIVRSEIISAFGCSTARNQLSIILLSTIDKSEDFQFSDNDRVQLIQNVYSRSYLGTIETVNFLLNENSEVKEVYKSADIEKICLNLAEYINSMELRLKFNLLLAKMNLDAIKVIEAKNVVNRRLWWIADYGGIIFKSIKTNSASNFYSCLFTIIGGLIAAYYL